MPRIELCDEDEITRLVHGFYARVRQDATLGPFFDAHVVDWDGHLAKMVDFWSSTLRRTARYRGTPMPEHAALPGLDVRMFERWLLLFRETTLALRNPALRERADDLATCIAQSLWYGYQMSDAPDQLPQAQWLLEGAEVCWIAAFGIYLWRFAPLMVRPGSDASRASITGSSATTVAIRTRDTLAPPSAVSQR